MLKWILIFPLVGFLINGFWQLKARNSPTNSKANAKVAGTIATLAIFSAFIVSLLSFFHLTGLPEHERVISQTLFSWIDVGALKVDFALTMDSLSSIFCLVITGVGSLIHLYSIGYMSEDKTPAKYFAYLNLFCFAMLVLVLGSSLPIMFLGWEGVGLCSYLLIGYWYEDNEKASAGKKAFIVNRIGDFGFLLGLFLIFSTFGTLDFATLQTVVQQKLSLGAGAEVLTPAITAICLLLFLGCCGKSAQIPLYVWLPDAMAGPTPVSALIHAATMVTSGIYLISRLNFLYILSPMALEVVAWTGAITALFAATMAVAQTDIKKVLAYSTVSQLGYMFLGCGVGAFGAGVFHVMTHAFFKALLFLGAGSVIHGMHHEQDILKMGGLKKYMPMTYMTFLIGWLAICGFPGLSGFFSKDEILWMSFSSHHGSPLLWGVGFVTALLTAFYMTRLFSLTFLGKFRGGHEAEHHVHESPSPIVIPLIVLAALSAVGGYLGIPHVSILGHWLEPVIPEIHGSQAAPEMEWILMALSGGAAMVIMFVTLKLYSNLSKVEKMRNQFAGVYKLLYHKWYVDELYEKVFITPIRKISEALWKYFDVAVIDKLVVGMGRISMWTGQTIRVAQTGSVQAYAVALLLGILLTMGYFFYGMA